MITYLSNALGFFLQLVPCAVMVFLPFPEERLRLPRRHILFGTVAGAAAASALFPLIIRAVDTEMAGDLMILLAAAVTLTAAVWLIREPAMKKVLVFFVVLFYALSQFWLVNAALTLLPEEKYLSRATYGPYAPVATLLYTVSAAVSLPVMLRYVVRPLRDFLREMDFEEMRREFTIAILTTTVLAGAMMYVYNYGYNSVYYRITVLLELLLILEQVVIFWLVFQETLRRKRDNEKRRALEIQKLQYDKISQEMESARRFRHDLRHHLNVLGTLNAQGKREEITEYLKEYGAVADRLESVRSSGDPVVDSVLSFYLTQAEELSVPVKCEVSLGETSGVEATDMTVLLGNLLENALAALERLPEERRQLHVELRAAKSMILLRIRNTCGEQDDTGGPTGWKTFSGGDGRRGVGLSSAAAIAEKYNGSALFERRDGVFTTRVILSPKPDRE